MGGVLILGGVLVVFAVVAIDRILAQWINALKLSIYEAIFFVLALTLYLYNNRTLEVELLNQDSDFLIVIENNGDFENDGYHYHFPFDRSLQTIRNHVMVENVPDDVDVIIPKAWDGSYYYNRYSYPHYPKVVLFGKSSSKMDSISVKKYIEEKIDKNIP